MKRLGTIVAVLFLLVGALPSQARAAPLNDDFADAQLLEGEFGEVPATNKKAAKEAGEPNHADNAGGRSVWFHWIAQRPGTLSVWTAKSAFDTLLAVYTGSSVDALTELASNDDIGVSTNSRVSFATVVGTDYFIAVDGYDGANGPFLLRWRQGPENDDFADAQLLTDDAGSVTGTAFGATVETGEPAIEGAATAWYRWTASRDATFGFAVSEEAREVAIYTGTSVDALTPIAEGKEALFAASAGTEYSIAVAGWRPGRNEELGSSGESRLPTMTSRMRAEFTLALEASRGRSSLRAARQVSQGTVRTLFGIAGEPPGRHMCALKLRKAILTSCWMCTADGPWMPFASSPRTTTSRAVRAALVSTPSKERSISSL